MGGFLSKLGDQLNVVSVISYCLKGDLYSSGGLRGGDQTASPGLYLGEPTINRHITSEVTDKGLQVVAWCDLRFVTVEKIRISCSMHSHNYYVIETLRPLRNNLPIEAREVCCSSLFDDV